MWSSVVLYEVVAISEPGRAAPRFVIFFQPEFPS